MQKYWDDTVASFYDDLYPDHWRDESVAELILKEAEEIGRRLTPVTSLAIIDVSCGTGNPSFALVDGGFCVTYTDGSQRMLDRLVANFASERRGPPELFCCSWHDLPSLFPDRRFDVLICTGNSISHVPPTADGLDAVLRNFVALLKPGGLCFLDVKKYDARYRELNLGPDGTTLSVRVIRDVDIPAAGRKVSRRFHLESKYDLDGQHLYVIDVSEVDTRTGLSSILGRFEFWPNGAHEVVESLRRAGCAQVHVFDMRATKHKYDLIAGVGG